MYIQWRYNRIYTYNCIYTYVYNFGGNQILRGFLKMLPYSSVSRNYFCCCAWPCQRNKIFFSFFFIYKKCFNKRDLLCYRDGAMVFIPYDIFSVKTLLADKCEITFWLLKWQASWLVLSVTVRWDDWLKPQYG